MKKVLSLSFAAASFVALAACTPQGDTGTTDSSSAMSSTPSSVMMQSGAAKTVSSAMMSKAMTK